MQMEELRPELRRWTAPHPAWRAGADWPRDVGCVYYETGRATVLVDPLIPASEEESSWRALDDAVARTRRPVVVVLTAPWHSRSTAEVVRRYDAECVAADFVPTISALAVPPVEERQLALFLEDHNALVTAEILADNGRGLAVFPSPSLRDRSKLGPFLERLCGLPVELILPAHGPPVLGDAPTALASAVDRWFTAR